MFKLNVSGSRLSGIAGLIGFLSISSWSRSGSALLLLLSIGLSSVLASFFDFLLLRLLCILGGISGAGSSTSLCVLRGLVMVVMAVVAESSSELQGGALLTKTNSLGGYVIGSADV